MIKSINLRSKRHIISIDRNNMVININDRVNWVESYILYESKD